MRLSGMSCIEDTGTTGGIGLLAFTAIAVFIFVYVLFSFCESILIGKQKRRMRTRSFGDDPYAVTCGCAVGAHEAKTLLQAELVLLLVLFGDFSPVARDMARKELRRVLSGFFGSGQCAGCGGKPS